MISRIDRVINRRIHSYERHLPRLERLKRWHRHRDTYNTTPIPWILAFIWWRPHFQWLWQLRCRNQTWRMERHNKRPATKHPDIYTWSR